MKRSDHKTKNKLIRRCLALIIALLTFTALGVPDYGILPRFGAVDEDLMPLAASESELLAHFDFENGLTDLSTNNVSATLVDGDGNTVTETDYLTPENGNNTYLDLSGPNAYLSLKKANGSGVLDNMAEVTVEMRLKTASDSAAQWAFYAAPFGHEPTRYPQNDEYYLSVHLANGKAFARRYNRNRPNGTPNSDGLSVDMPTNEWYTLKVVYEAGKTTLSVTKDGKTDTKFATDLSANVWECLGENSSLWFGYSGWREYFNGCIDDIKIWGTSRDEVTDSAAAVENDHIITDDVADPAKTTVNMFDYWVFGDQNDRDYGLTYKTQNDLVNSGINKGHLFLFDGSASIGWPGDSGELGLWNRYNDDDNSNNDFEFEPKSGIVKNILPDDGYPRLALDSGVWAAPSNSILSGLWTDAKRTESLDYLFKPIDGDYKVAYPNVTGLFRVNDFGYYYFRSQEVFAELNREQAYESTKPKTSTNRNRVTLYDTPWREEYARGQFFPFNDWTQLFYEVNGNIGQWGDQGYQADFGGQPMNHWFGMTIETEFMQPVDGTLYNGDHMTFEFSGDDDVWIFIDNVLVADVGGNHSRIRVNIDYSTGKVEYEKELDYTGMSGKKYTVPGGNDTLYDIFEAAGKLNETTWNGKTFGDNTIHTLKFFYLERGNAASNCNISFNLQEPIVDHIRKVDQNGDPLAGAKFELYEAAPKTPTNIDDEWWKLTADDFDTVGTPITTTVSDGGGYAALTTEDGGPLDLARINSEYYILRETATPAGYRKNPDIVLQYHDDTNTLTVVNKYEVGAYASFLSEWTSLQTVSFADYANGTFSDRHNDATAQLENGLAIVVPVIRQSDSLATATWYPMYGSNTLGWNTVKPASNSKNDLIKALAEAAFMQIADTDPKTQHWYLRWDKTQLKGKMENLPGDATRYSFNGEQNSDGELVTLFLPEDVLKNTLGLNGTYANDVERYTALSKILAGRDIKTVVANLSGLELLFTGDFEKTNRTVIYVSNEQRELRVRKVNEKGDPIRGAVFALFDNISDAANSTNVKASGTTGANGELIFRADGLTYSEVNDGYGYAKMIWSSDASAPTAVYWLKEITAPSGYELNKNLIRVEVGNVGIYANATGFDLNGAILEGAAANNDGIRVEASLGGLTQTLVKYAEGIVDETLKYITVTEQTASSIDTWADGAGKDLTYKTNGYDPVTTFTAEDDYIRIMPRQTEVSTAPTAKRDDLTDIDLDGLFSMINTVVVTDRARPDTGYIPNDPNEPNESDDPNEPNVPEEPNGTDEPNGSDTSNKTDDASKPYDNPSTGNEMRLVLRFAVMALTLIAVANPIRKRGKR